MKWTVSHKILPILLMFSLPAACSSSRSTASGTSNGDELSEEQNGKASQDVEVRKEGWEGMASDPFEYEGAAVEGDHLRLEVRYSGGCETHRFRLYTKREYSKSDPPALRLSLLHDAKGDACRSVIRDTLRYDLKELRHPNSKELLLQLNGYGRKLRYAY